MLTLAEVRGTLTIESGVGENTNVRVETPVAAESPAHGA
jgi:hypothetical protein